MDKKLTLLIFTQLLKIILRCVGTIHLNQNAPHDFLYIPQLWELCTSSVHPATELQIYL